MTLAYLSKSVASVGRRSTGSEATEPTGVRILFDEEALSGTGLGQQNYQNHSNLAAERWHRYEIAVTGQDYIVGLNGQEATRFRRATADAVRGNPPSVDPKSGFIGLQTHTGHVAFANIRIKK